MKEHTSNEQASSLSLSLSLLVFTVRTQVFSSSPVIYSGRMIRLLHVLPIFDKIPMKTNVLEKIAILPSLTEIHD